jgi:hypothetical protein
MNMGNMREISIEECRMVSGGETPVGTVVNGCRPWWYNMPGLVYSYASGTFSFAPAPTSFGSSGGGGGGGGGGNVLEYDPDGDDDNDDISNMDEEIVVTGDRTLPTGFKEVPGGYYMYELKSDGTRGPLQFTPWYADLTCEIYDSHQKAIGKTSSTYGYLATAIGVLGNGAGSGAATAMGLLAEGTGVNNKPAHCPDR